MKHASDFWNDQTILSKIGDKTHTSSNVISLFSLKKAVSNYVNILYGDDIDVTFNFDGRSYTDGKKVVLSTELNTKEDIDVAVGLALHEASHLKYTDIDFFSKINFEDLMLNYVPLEYHSLLKENYELGEELYNYLKTLINLMEDVRLDAIIFNEAPGYRDYYRALYKKYFYNKEIDKALASDEFTDETVDSYLFRVINSRNAKSDFTKLKGLADAWRIIDLNNILRLRNISDSCILGCEVFKVTAIHILENIAKQQEQGDGEKDRGGADTNNSLDKKLDNKDKKKLKKSALDRVAEAIFKQEDLINNNVSHNIKGSIDKMQGELINAMTDANIDIDGEDKSYNNEHIFSSNVITIKKFNKRVVDSDLTSCYTDDNGYDKILNDGISLGKYISTKLNVRNTERTDVYNGQRSGKLDKRSLHTLSYDNDRVFTKVTKSAYKPINLHLSVDASASMAGSAWDSSITIGIALMYASTQIENLNVQVSLRSNTRRLLNVSSHSVDNTNTPSLLIAFDSRTDNFKTCAALLAKIKSGGLTPESLCYPSIYRNFLKGNVNQDYYFVTITDGAPNFVTQDAAVAHIQKEVNKFKKANVGVMAYYIDDDGGYSKNTFFKSYGSDGKVVSVDSLKSIVRTLNNLFVKK